LPCSIARGRHSGLERRQPFGYTIGMKTAISLPERVFDEAERFARRSRKSRSQLYVEAIVEYLARHAPNEITEAMNRICESVGQSDIDQFASAAAKKTIARESW